LVVPEKMESKGSHTSMIKMSTNGGKTLQQKKKGDHLGKREGTVEARKGSLLESQILPGGETDF